MPDFPESEVNEAQSESNIDAPPGQLGASNRLERSGETETERIRRLTEQALAIAGAAGTASANAIMSLSEGSDGSKMEDDNLTADEKLPEKIQGQPKRIARTEAALAATTVFNQLTRSFPGVLNKPVLGEALTWAPAAFLKPERQRRGAMALVSDPRALSLAAVTGLAIAKSMKGGAPYYRRFEIKSYRERLAQGTTQTFKTNAPSRRPVKWESSDRTKAIVNEDTGEVTGVAPGPVTIIARSAGFEYKVGLTIE
jgi:Bacterial Ig-like domain (group 2)